MVKKVKKSSLKKTLQTSEATVSKAKSSKKAVKAVAPSTEDEQPTVKAAKPGKVDKTKKPEESATQKEHPDKTALAAEAAEEILKKIAKPESQQSGAFVLPDWHLKYKDALGHYKKFVKSCDKLQVIEQGNGKYIIQKAGDKTKPPPLQSNKDLKKDWKQLLLSAWNIYAQATPVQERNMEVFISALPKGVRQVKPEAESSEAKSKEPKEEESSKPIKPAKTEKKKVVKKVKTKAKSKA